MSDETRSKAPDQDRKLEEAFEQIEKKATPPATSTSSSTSLTGVMALLVALVALGVASYPAYEMYQQTLTGQTDPLAEEVSALAGRIAALESADAPTADQDVAPRIDALAAELATAVEAQQTFQQQVAQQLADISRTSSRQWILAEIEYLVRMAGQRVLMEQDAESALLLLRAADEIAGATEGLTAHKLREALARDIAALEAVDAPDTQGIYLALAAQVDQVPVLKRSQPVFEPVAKTGVDVEREATKGALGQSIERMLERFATLVDFRRDQVPVKPILPPAEEYFLRQNLIMKLQIAQMALMEGNQAVYESALADAATWVAEGFDVDDPATVAMHKKLSSLALQRVAVVLPDISGSLRAARDSLGDFGRKETR